MPGVKHCLVVRSIALAATISISSVFADAQVVREAAGADKDSIKTSVAEYQTDLGALNKNDPGSVGSGRREINWDGVSDALSAPHNLPVDFFNQNFFPRARGVVFGGATDQFQVSADDANPDNAAKDFGNIRDEYARDFADFTPQRMFTSLGSNIYDIEFFIPGSNEPALVRGFGAVFSDVDLSEKTKIEYFDNDGNVLLAHDVLAAGIGHETYSFLGVSWDSALVRKVRITAGTDALNPNLGDRPDNSEFPVDLVVADDFIYGEPVPIPEPTSACLLLATGLLALRHRR